ncbi:UDP-N-acetylmuramate--L-alanine ligase [Candidatus Daviesbacteria bacterium]|nr:UDP-N-acetylmuramate--L-alanine ligase [Candidatus Daviesbacteria bacterium]
MDLENIAVVVLAAGKGTRFGESYTKLLHPIFRKPLIYYPIQNLKNLGINNIITVLSDPKVEDEIKKYIECDFVYQRKLLGTADAVKLALTKFSFTPLRWEAKTVMVINGDDATLYTKKTLEEFLRSHEANRTEISLMTIKTPRAMEAGRVIRDKKGNFSKILEYKEYLESGTVSKEINCGVYLFNTDFLRKNLPKVEKSQNGEYYLTDLLNIAKEQGKRINLFVLKNHSEWIGINDKKDLKYAENVISKRGLIMKEEKLPKKIVHFLGIAGSGTSSCAAIARSYGYTISGCDINPTDEFTKPLKGVDILKGHSKSHLQNVDLLVVTPAIFSLDPNNEELIEAKERKMSKARGRDPLKILTWQQFLGRNLTKDKFVIAVCGTHGKSTTTAMIGKLLGDANLDPTIMLGANVKKWGGNFKIGHTKYFVVEADEFNDNYMSLTPDVSVVTNIEFDHPEYFKDFAIYKRSFQNFLHKTKKMILANLEDSGTRKTLLEENAQYGMFFKPVSDYSKNLIDFPLKVLGSHNILNASAAYHVGVALGINPKVIKSSLKNFDGIDRRIEYLGNINGAKVYSDFGHHPTEIKVTVQALRQKYHDREVIVLFQPHMFSRTKALFSDFVEVFRNLPVKKAYILDIYPSREIDTGLVDSKQLVQAIGKENVQYSRNLSKTFQELTNQLTNRHLVIFMGAGDIDQKIRLKIND